MKRYGTCNRPEENPILFNTLYSLCSKLPYLNSPAVDGNHLVIDLFLSFQLQLSLIHVYHWEWLQSRMKPNLSQFSQVNETTGTWYSFTLFGFEAVGVFHIPVLSGFLLLLLLLLFFFRGGGVKLINFKLSVNVRV